jgi:GT2 family glycosyltransferase
MSTKKVAIILVNWNSYALTNDCIQSLKQTSSKDFDIIVVDNGSQDDSGLQLKTAHPDIILLSAGANLGFTGGNNLGMRYAVAQNYPYTFLLNNDTFVEPDFLDPLIQYMDTNTAIGAVQPRIFFHHNRNLIWNNGSFYSPFTGRTYTRSYQRTEPNPDMRPQQVDWITGCAFFIRTEILKQTGLFAENFFIYFEDVDLSFRIKKAGYALCYIPQSVIYHIAGESHKKPVKGKEGRLSAKVHYLHTRNNIWFLKKHTPIPYLPTVCLYNFFYLIGVMAYFVARLRFQKLQAVWKGIRDGINGHVQYN